MLEKITKRYPAAKEILLIAGLGAFIAGSLVMPGLPRIFAGRKIDWENFLDEDKWQKFDERRLRWRLKQMRRSKLIKIYVSGDRYVVQITTKGRKRLLQYRLRDLQISTPRRWDGRWRIVAYDIPNTKSHARDMIRETLKRLGFLQLQRSVYLFPYPCGDAIEFLREVYRIGEHTTLLTVGYLEGEGAYKEYFGL